MSEIKILDLPERQISDQDYALIVNPDGTHNKGKYGDVAARASDMLLESGEVAAILNEAQAAVDNASKYSATGRPVISSSSPISDEQLVQATQAGTYTNFGGLVVSSEEIKSVVRLVKVDGVWSKDIKTIPVEAITSEAVNKAVEQVFNPELIQGYKVLAKGQVGTAGSRLVQPYLYFNVDGTTWAGGGTFNVTFRCTILVKGSNALTIDNAILQSVNSPHTTTVVAQNIVGGGAVLTEYIEYAYTFTKTITGAKTSYLRWYLNFNPINEDTVNEIVIFNASLDIAGSYGILEGIGLRNPNGTDSTQTITSLSGAAATVDSLNEAKIEVKTESVLDSKAYTDEEIYDIVNPIAIDGFRYVAKANNLARIQPIFAFDLTGITYGSGSSVLFECKILLKTDNIVNIPIFQHYYNGIATIDNTTGNGITSNGVETISPGVIKQYSKLGTITFAKQNYGHYYIGFDPVSDSLATEIIIYDVVLKIGGVTCPQIAGTALYRTVSGDIIQKVDALGQLPTYKYIDEVSASLRTYTDSKVQASPVVNFLASKKFNMLGDSLTFGHGVGASSTFAKVLADRNAMDYVSYGISGTCLALVSNGSGLSMSNPSRYGAMRNDADYVGVWGTTNDITAQVPIGVNSDSTVATIKGALNLMCIGLIEKYPSAKLFFVTPLNHKITTIPVKAYRDAIVEICGMYGIAVLDLYTMSGFYPLNQIQRNSLMYNAVDPTVTPTTDVQHPNVYGHLLLSRTVESFMRSL